MPVPDTKSYRTAKALTDANISVLPLRHDSPKQPAIEEWGVLQTRIGTDEELQSWFKNGNGIGIIGGKVSGNLLMLDFDREGIYELYEQSCIDHDMGDLVQSLPLMRSPSGGNHLYLRCTEPVCGNRILARASARKPLIETRGEGGYVVAFPSPGYTIVRGKPNAVPIITPEQCEFLFQIAALFNEYTPPELPAFEPSPPREPGSGLAPGEEYNERGEYEAVLSDAGWTRTGRSGGKTTWKRPGKTEPGISATSNYMGSRQFYCFTTACDPFLHEKSYSPFGVYATIKHGGDYKAAARQLGIEGYGNQSKTPRRVQTPPQGATEVLAVAEGAVDDNPNASDDMLAEEWGALVEKQYAFVEGDQWYRYSSNHWQKSSPTQAGIDLHLWLKKKKNDGNKVAVTAAKIAAIQKLTHAYLGLHSLAEYNAHADWVPLANGVYDIPANALMPHDPDHKITYIAPYEYDENAVCPIWRQCLNEWLITNEGDACQEWIDLMQEWFGYCLIPDTKAQVSMLWSGEGGNGKGVATRVLTGLIGRNNCTNIPIDQLHDPYHRAGLHGKLVGFVNEPDKRSMQKNGNWFKAIVGCDTISGRNPTERPFDFEPICRIVMSTNELPSTSDTSIGYFRRLLMIDWRYNVPAEKRDADLDDKLRHELPGIFNWAMEGLRRYKLRGKLVEPEESKKLLAAYQAEQDTFLRFFAENYQIDANGWTANEAIYGDYKRWGDAMNERVVPQTVVSKRLQKMGAKNTTNRPNGKVTRGWKVSSLSDKGEEEYE